MLAIEPAGMYIRSMQGSELEIAPLHQRQEQESKRHATMKKRVSQLSTCMSLETLISPRVPAWGRW